MPEVPYNIQNHQRILITGSRAQEILESCRKVLDSQSKPYDFLTDQEQSIGSGPIVFIVSENYADYDPHIILIDMVNMDHRNEFEALANDLPKSGTLVYNGSDEIAKEIGSKERDNVHREEYHGDDVTSAAKKLVRRIGISEEIFDKAF